MSTYKNKYGFIKQQMNSLAIPYELGGWESKVTYPYFTGEPTETPTTSEDGYEESTLLLTGFHRGKYIVLEEIKEKVKKHFDSNYGLRASTYSGSIAVFFDGCFQIQTGEAELKRIQINLLIKEWKQKGDM